MSNIPPGDPTAGLTPGKAGARAYIRSLIPPEPRPFARVTPSTTPVSPTALHDPSELFFDPKPALADRVIQSFFSPNSSLASIACDHDTTVEALAAWMARPDIAARFQNLTSASATRLRMVAVGRLHHALEAVTVILQEFTDSACHTAGIQQGRGASPSEHIRRDRETARKASALMLRLATFDPTTPRSQSLRTSQSPRGNAGATRGADLTAAAGALPTHYTTTISLPTYTAPKEPLASAGGETACAADSLAAATNRQDSEPTPTVSPSEISNLKFEIPPAPTPSTAQVPAPSTPSSTNPKTPPPSEPQSPRSERNTLGPARKCRERSETSREPAKRATQTDPPPPKARDP